MSPKSASGDSLRNLISSSHFSLLRSISKMPFWLCLSGPALKWVFGESIPDQLVHNAGLVEKVSVVVGVSDQEVNDQI